MKHKKNKAIENLEYDLDRANRNLHKVNVRIAVATNDWVEVQETIIDIDDALIKLKGN